jgi:hypothetical protein
VWRAQKLKTNNGHDDVIAAASQISEGAYGSLSIPATRSTRLQSRQSSLRCQPSPSDCSNSCERLGDAETCRLTHKLDARRLPTVIAHQAQFMNSRPRHACRKLPTSCASRPMRSCRFAWRYQKAPNSAMMSAWRIRASPYHAVNSCSQVICRFASLMSARHSRRERLACG